MQTDITYADGHIEPAVDFDYDAVQLDRGNPIAAEMERDPHDLADAFDRVMWWCLMSGNSRVNLKGAFIRFVAMSMALKPGIFGGQSYESVAEKIGVEKAWLSKLAVKFQDEFGVHFRRGRADAARVVFKKTAKRTHDKRKRLDRNKRANGTAHRRFGEAYRQSGAED